nr:ribonuclease H-like domain, reverse transcriptase, RNA-dependent DNA polymerase [Tanacetum cinerariifolium]
MATLAFCDYHNMVAILEKIEHNTDFYQIVDFLKASHIKYALMIRPTVHVSHIRQFWSTTRVKTMDGETKILAQCLSLKSTSFNEFSNIATALVYLATNKTYNFSKMIFDGIMRNVKSKGKFLMYPRTVELFASMLVPHGEGSEHPSKPHHTPSDQDELIHHESITQSSQHAQITSHEPTPRSHEQTTSQEPTIPSQSHSVITTPRRITRGLIRISQSKVPSPGADETAFPTGDVRYEEAFPTEIRLDAGQDRENIAKTSA